MGPWSVLALCILLWPYLVEAGPKLSETAHQLIPGVEKLEDGSLNPEEVMFDFTGIPQGGNLPELTEALEEIITKYPNTCFVYAWLAGHYAKAQRCDQLPRLAARSLQYCSNNSLTLADVGQAHADCQDPERSEKFLKKAVKVNPDSGARSSLARLYGMTGRNEPCIQEATTYIDRHKETLKESPGIREPLTQAYNMLGVCLVQLGRTDEAFQWFEEALKISPSDPLILDNYRWAKEQGKRKSVPGTEGTH